MPILTIALASAISIFLFGNICRAARIIRMPAHLRWELYPIPKGPRNRQRYGGSYFEEAEWWTKSMDTGRRGELTFMLKEIFLLRGVYENFRDLWIWSLLLHWGLYLYMVSTAVVVADIAIAAHRPGGSSFLSVGVAGYGVACILGVFGSCGLMATRFLHPRLKGFSTRATVFNLCLLAGIFATGLIGLFIPDHGLLRALRDAVDWRHGSGGHPLPAYLHFGLVAFFLAYFSFTHMTHMYMKYFTWHGVRWDDMPARFDEKARQAITENLARPVSWQAPHVRGTIGQSWTDVATRSGQNREAGHD